MAALWTRSWGTTIQVSGHLQVIYAHFMRPILREYWCRGNEKGKEKQKKNKSAEKSLQPKQDISSAQTLLQPGCPRRGSVPTVHVLNKRLKGNMKAHSRDIPTANIFDKTKSQKLHSSLDHKVWPQPTDAEMIAFSQRETVPIQIEWIDDCSNSINSRKTWTFINLLLGKNN